MCFPIRGHPWRQVCGPRWGQMTRARRLTATRGRSSNLSRVRGRSCRGPQDSRTRLHVGFEPIEAAAPQHVLEQQAIPMSWDFAEGNPFGESSGALAPSVEWVSKVIEKLTPGPPGIVRQLDATSALGGVDAPLTCDLLPLLRQHRIRGPVGFLLSMADALLFTTNLPLYLRHDGLTAKSPAELIASPYRFEGDKKKALIVL